jgi:hypothetical protein
LALVVKWNTIKAMSVLAGSKGWNLDVKTTFLNKHSHIMKFTCRSHGPYEVLGNEHLVCRLFQALYGFKQAPLQWFQEIDNFFEEKHIANIII